jgi:hypothetical protein
MNVTIYASGFHCSDEIVQEETVLSNIMRPKESSASAINVKTIKSFTMEMNEFKYCYGASSGGVIRLDDTTFEDYGSLF